MAKPLGRSLNILAVIVGIGCMVTAAGLIGYSAGSRVGFQESFYCHTLHIKQELSALKNLKEGRTEEVRSNLETGLILAVALVTGKETTELMKPGPKAAIETSLREVKAYRQSNPWQGYDEKLHVRIDNALKNIPDAAHP